MIDIRNYIQLDPIPATFTNNSYASAQQFFFHGLESFRLQFKFYFESIWDTEYTHDFDGLRECLLDRGIVGAALSNWQNAGGYSVIFLPGRDTVISFANAEGVFLNYSVSSDCGTNPGISGVNIYTFNSDFKFGQHSQDPLSVYNTYRTYYADIGLCGEENISKLDRSVAIDINGELDNLGNFYFAKISQYYQYTKDSESHTVLYGPGEGPSEMFFNMPASTGLCGVLDVSDGSAIPGDMKCFTDLETFARWIYEKTVNPPILPNKSGIAIPPISDYASNPELVTIPGWNIPPLNQRLQFQNYCFNVPNLKFLKGK